MSPSHNAHNWLGMGVYISPSAYENNLYCNYLFDHELNNSITIADQQQQQPKEWKVLRIQDKCKRIFTILEVQCVGFVTDDTSEDATTIGCLLVHPCISECLLYLQSILPSSSEDSLDNVNTDKSCTLVNCFSLYISHPSPAVTMLPLPSSTDISTCNQVRTSNHAGVEFEWFAEEIESIYCPHPSLYIQYDNNIHCVSPKDTSHVRNSCYSIKLCITLCYCNTDICINASLSTTEILIQSIKQALVHRLLTKDMILLLPIPYSCWERIRYKHDTTAQIVSQPQTEEGNVCYDDEDEILHFIVHHVGPTEEIVEDKGKCYRIGPVESFEVKLLPMQKEENDVTMANIQTTKHILHNQEETEAPDPACPGYNSLLQNLVQLATLPFGKNTIIPQVILASNSPVLLSGCSGVGKTRLVSSLITTIASLSSKQQIPLPFQSHVISMKDLLSIHNSYNSYLNHKDMLLDYIVPLPLLQSVRYSSNWTVLILDDIDLILGPDKHEMDSDDFYEATEDASNAIHALIGNAISKAIKLLLEQNTNEVSYSACPHQNPSVIPSPFILGVSRVPLSQLPRELRLFEKEIVMPPPDLPQREAILKFWLQQLPVDDDNDSKDAIMSAEVVIERWARALSPALAGCVASDLRRMCADAFTTAMSRYHISNGDNENQEANLRNSPHVKVKWPDILEAVRNCIPSPLVALDVTPPYIQLGEDDGSDVSIEVNFHQRHEQCWSRFGGYLDVKDRLYRTLVGPWRRHLSGHGGMMGITPPTGVIFYGPSGVGKTFAAECLASSLGLNVIKVK